MDKKIGIASDHAGYELKEFLVGYLDSMGYDVFDFGCDSEQSCDYPDYAHPLGAAIDSGELVRGIAICGSGNGINMTVNKHAAVRGALCWMPEIAELARRHNNANVLTLPARYLENSQAVEILDIFLSTEFEGGRHQTRVDKIPVKPELSDKIG